MTQQHVQNDENFGSQGDLYQIPESNQEQQINFKMESSEKESQKYLYSEEQERKVFQSGENNTELVFLNDKIKDLSDNENSIPAIRLKTPIDSEITKQEEERKALIQNHQRRKSLLKMILRGEKENLDEDQQQNESEKQEEINEGSFSSKLESLRQRKASILGTPSRRIESLGTPNRSKLSDSQSPKRRSDNFGDQTSKKKDGYLRLMTIGDEGEIGESSYFSKYVKQNGEKKQEQQIDLESISSHSQASVEKKVKLKNIKNQIKENFNPLNINLDIHSTQSESKQDNNIMATSPKNYNYQTNLNPIITTETGNSKTKGNVQKGSEIYEDREASVKAVEFVRRMNEERKRAREQKQDTFERLTTTNSNKYSSSTSSLSQASTIEKRSQIKKKMEEMKVRSEDRKQLKILSDDIIKQLQSDLKLNSIEERFKQEQEIGELERRKKVLAEKRKMFQPVTIEEIKEHAKKHDTELKLKKLQSKQNILIDYSDIELLEKYPRYQVMTRILEGDKNFKMQQQLQKEKVKQFNERKKEYSKLVQQVHIPSKKQLEYEDIQEVDENNSNGQYSNRQEYYFKKSYQFKSTQEYNHNILSQHPKKAQSSYHIMKEGKSNKLQLPFSLPIKSRQSHNNNNNISSDNNNISNRSIGIITGNNTITPSSANHQHLDQINHAQRSFHEKSLKQIQEQTKFTQKKNSYHNNEIEESASINLSNQQQYEKLKQKQNQSVNYIKDIRRQREELEKKKGKSMKLENWEKYSEDPYLSPNQKNQFVLQSAARLDHNAKMKELSHKQDLSQKAEAGNLYINSIQAKLSVLDSLI